MRESAYLIRAREWLEHLKNQHYSIMTVTKSYRWPVLAAFKGLKNKGYTTLIRAIGPEEALFVIQDVFKGRAKDITAWNQFLLYNNNPVVELLNYKINPITRKTVDWLNLKENEDFKVRDAAIDLHERALIHAELFLGMRKISVMRMQLEWLKGPVLDILGKGRHGGKWRTIAPYAGTTEIFAELKEEHQRLAKKADLQWCPDNLLVYYKGGKIKPHGSTSIDNILEKVSVRAEIEFSHHTLRRTAGRRQWKAGVKIEEIAKFLGHDDIRQTMDYIGVTYDDTEAAMRAVEKYDEDRKRLASESKDNKMDGKSNPSSNGTGGS